MSSIVITLIKLYQKLFSPLFQKSCRFYPSCSQYSIEAFEAHGFFIGLYLTLWRIFRCNPFCKCGYDPVPVKNFDGKILKTIINIKSNNG